MSNIKLDPIEGYEYYGSAGWWDGYAAGAKAASEMAKEKLLRDILGRRITKPAPGPVPVPDAEKEA